MTRWTDLPLRRKGLVVVAFPLIGLLLATTTFILAGQANARAHVAVTRSLAVDAQLSRVLGLVVDIETGVRGFLLTRQKAFLEPYETARAALPEAIEELDSLVTGPSQHARLARLRRLVDARLELSARLRRFPPQDGAPSPELVRALAEGKATTDEVRTQVEAMVNAESVGLARQRSRAAGAHDLARAAGVVGALLGLIGGIGSAGLFTRGITRRVNDLEHGAQLLEEGLPVIAPPGGADEIGRLGGAVARASGLLRRREAALADARGFLERLVSAGPTVVVRLTVPDLRAVYASPNIERLFGIPVAEALAADGLGARVHPDDLPGAQAAVARVVDGSATQECVEVRLRCGEGGYRWISAVILPEAGDDGRCTGILGYLFDIDARRRAEDALREREATLQAIFDNSPDIITITGLDGLLRSANPALTRIRGYEVAERLGRSTFELVHPEDRPVARAAFDRLLSGGSEHVVFRIRSRHADGRWIVLESQASVLTGPAGEPAGVLAVTRDVTEQARLEQAQQQARETAEAANRSKSEFLSRMSHELRTPLNAVLGFAQLLELDDLSLDQRDSVAHILKAGRHLLDLIDEVLDISRLEAGRLNLSPEPVSLGHLFDEVLGLIGPVATEAGIDLLFPDPEACGFVLADRPRLRQILLKLLSNAVKYNRPGGTVAVSCEPVRNGRLRIDVADTGPGIRPEHVPLLFTPFERLGAEHSGVDGTGIGLALSRRLAEVMDGSLDVTTNPGQGSTFHIELPAAEGPIERYARLNDATAAPTPADSGPQGTILHIEDNLANLKLVERMLTQRTGVALVGASQGRLGLELAREYRPRLILLDLHLPDLNGDEVLRRLRDDPVTASIPVVIVSADAANGEIRRLLAAGAAGYLTKPINVREMLHLVDDLLAGARAPEPGSLERP